MDPNSTFAIRYKTWEGDFSEVMTQKKITDPHLTVLLALCKECTDAMKSWEDDFSAVE